MRIEERCACGAMLRLAWDKEPGRSMAVQTDNNIAERDAWKQVDRWRKLHAACRVVQPSEGKALDA